MTKIMKALTGITKYLHLCNAIYYGCFPLMFSGIAQVFLPPKRFKKQVDTE